MCELPLVQTYRELSFPPGRLKPREALTVTRNPPSLLPVIPAEEGAPVAVELRGVVKDVEFLHRAVQTDSSQLEVHGELSEHANWTELELAVVFQQRTCRQNKNELCRLSISDCNKMSGS